MDLRLIFYGVITLILILIYTRSQKSRALIKEKRGQLNNASGKKFYLCDAVDDLGDNLVQFYGGAVGTILPGMQIIMPDGMSYIIKEVYGDEKIPDRPSAQIPDGMDNAAIVIEAPHFGFESLRPKLKQERVLALEVK